MQHSEETEALPIRAPYAPPPSFYADQHNTLDQIKGRIPSHKLAMLNESPLRLSPACLDVVTVAHRAFSQQTSTIEKAAAELFRRCLRLQEELVDQVKAMADLAMQVKEMNSRASDGTYGDGTNTSTSHQERIEAARVKQDTLVKRYEAIRRKAGQGQQKNQELSSGERVWIEDINSLADRIGETSSPPSDDITTLSARTERAKTLHSELLAATKSIKSTTAAKSDADQSSLSSSASRLSRSGPTFGVSRFQREKMQEVMNMVERESAIIEAVEIRLSKLKLST